MLFLAIYLGFVILFCGIWYWLSRRHIRRRAACVVSWIEAALEGQGRVIGMRWVGGARFKVPLRLASSVFRRTWMLVDLCPCEMPTQWLWNKIIRREEQVTFQADLDWAPPFSMDVHNFRWFARSSRKSSTAPAGWTLEQTGPFIITTRMQWPKEITSTMTSLVETRNREFHHISFSRTSPHFSVSMPLEAISPTCPSRTCVFDAVREVAASSLPSLF
jgi:hypothetical protein